jgi:K+-sensing histidine kinase KdpD
VAVGRDSDLKDLALLEREALERHLNFARNLHIEARVLQGHDVAGTLVEFARLNGVTHLFVARPTQNPKLKPFGRSVVQEVVRLARDMQVIIVADRGSRTHPQ